MSGSCFRSGIEVVSETERAATAALFVFVFITPDQGVLRNIKSAKAKTERR